MSQLPAQPTDPQFSQPPQWAKNAIWYQIFTERFRNSQLDNNPDSAKISVAPMNTLAPQGWQTTPWTQNWYYQEPWASNTGREFTEMLQYRRYGGDLQGVLDKLDYLQDLGINAIYFNPLNDAASYHKYDASYYHHIDVNFGPDPVGDAAIIASETPNEPNTWKWTAADKLFLQFLDEAHRRNMKVILDFSWNHTGTRFWAWEDILKNQEKSAYKNWYDIISFRDPNNPQSEFKYNGWIGISSLPEIKKTAINGYRQTGYPYESNLNEGAKAHIFEVSKRWLAPDGDTSRGIDGFRLDVADQIGLGFWRDYRRYVRDIKKETYLVGEIWWSEFPDKLMDPAPYVQGDIFDAVMFYQVYRPARYFFAKNDFGIDAHMFKDSLVHQWSSLTPQQQMAMMNVSSTHDAPRLLSDFYNRNKYKVQAIPRENPHYKTGKPDTETYERVRLYLLHLFTSIGSPQIWNGEEMGMWGGDDPDCRKPLWWPDLSFEPEYRNNIRNEEKTFDSVGFNKEHFEWYKKLIHLRKTNPVLIDGKMDFLYAEGKKLAYKRWDKKGNALWIYFNASDEPQTFELPQFKQWTNLLNKKLHIGQRIILPARSGAVLKPKK